MVAYRLQIVLGTTDNNPANYITNTWHCAAIGDSEAGDFVTSVTAAYNEIRNQLSPDVRQTNHEYKLYDLTDPEPRAPVQEGTWSLASAPAGTALPPEVSLCLSYQAPKISGVPQARRRGRIYLGPFNTASSSAGRPSATLITQTIALGQKVLDDGVASAGDWNWAVYSSILGGTADVTNGWVDNEFDTQRRRGRVATTRTVFS